MERINAVSRRTAIKKARNLAFYAGALCAFYSVLYLEPAVGQYFYETGARRERVRHLQEMAVEAEPDDALNYLRELRSLGLSDGKLETVRASIAERIESGISAAIRNERDYPRAIELIRRYKDVLDHEARIRLKGEARKVHPQKLLSDAMVALKAKKPSYDTAYNAAMSLFEKASGGFRKMGLEDKAVEEHIKARVDYIVYSIANNNIEKAGHELHRFYAHMQEGGKDLVPRDIFDAYLRSANACILDCPETGKKPEFVRQIFLESPAIAGLTYDAFGKSYLDGSPPLIGSYRAWARRVAETGAIDLDYVKRITDSLREIGAAYNLDMEDDINQIIEVLRKRIDSLAHNKRVGLDPGPGGFC